MITKIKVRMGQREVEMSMREAKRLYEDLHELFGTKETIVYRDHGWYWHHPRPYFDSGTVFCTTGNGSKLTADSSMDNQCLTLTATVDTPDHL